MSNVLVAALVTATNSATPLLLAALGETVAERSGVLNLGVEGLMLVGAVAAFVTTAATGSALVGIAAGAVAGAALALLFALLTLILAANQVASGLAITIFGTGLSSLVGAHFVGRSLSPLPRLHVPIISDIPVIGPLFFSYDGLVYFSVAMTGFLAWGFTKTRTGMVLRAVGDSDSSASALGYDVIRIRTLAVLFGGAMGGVAGAYVSLAATPMWIEGLTAGRGWIALALVVFGRVAAVACVRRRVSVWRDIRVAILRARRRVRGNSYTGFGDGAVFGDGGSVGGNFFGGCTEEVAGAGLLGEGFQAGKLREERTSILKKEAKNF